MDLILSSVLANSINNPKFSQKIHLKVHQHDFYSISPITVIFLAPDRAIVHDINTLGERDRVRRIGKSETQRTESIVTSLGYRSDYFVSPDSVTTSLFTREGLQTDHMIPPAPAREMSLGECTAYLFLVGGIYGKRDEDWTLRTVEDHRRGERIGKERERMGWDDVHEFGWAYTDDLKPDTRFKSPVT
ncbi:hypothetical protein BS47DRAFT_1364913 [Hydnum rufescens UP504]|uniref:Uncharacterized protein n=1 Tax=Hydnum rufescens UP504 TaxID=1448309 RepID=A0A9P6DPC9_9AGAM|nr:hypothetical protein BS47DRAFT_1364913 [Hydnum rufescens UP504]